MRKSVGVIMCCGVLCVLSACSPKDGENNEQHEIVEPSQEAPVLESRRMSLHLPTDTSAALNLAADDLVALYTSVLGKEDALTVSTESYQAVDSDIFITVTILEEDVEEIPEQGYRITVLETSAGRQGLQIEAEDDIAAMYAMYEIAAKQGARYHHPEETFLPAKDEDAALPWLSDFDGDVDAPRFALRGFHEHTQHPTPMSDFYLRPDRGEEFRPYVSRYMKWLARNRQNVASWQMLKTVDLDVWEPYISDIIEEAHTYGVKVGMVTSFSDEQQNNFKIILPERANEEGMILSEEEQIRQVLSRFDAMGFDFYTFQIGSSEFTKPGDQLTVDRLNSAAKVKRELDDRPELFTWIHMVCSLEDDDGGYFYHLAGDADPAVGTWVHTVMFHDLEHPAPVYDCESFNHQRDFLKQELGEREQVYFPESAWWLGFDNNMPLALPITGWTRSWDIKEELKGLDIRGHVTFTTGREWAYWQYDHFVAQAGWDDQLEWGDYLAWITQMYGDSGETVASVLNDWALLQKKHFFDENPEIYFYLAGELTQDEIGAKAGILARRPKIAYQDVVAYADDEFETWNTRDLEMLKRMKDECQTLLDEAFPTPPSAPASADASLEDKLVYEVWAGLYLYVRRIEHAIELYTGVVDVREWTRLYQGGAEFTDPQREVLLADAMVHLEAAKQISEDAQAIIKNVSSTTYRYPASILIEEKPESPTSYPYGYLEETERAYFWTRRDVQLEQLIADSFVEDLETWISEPAPIYYVRSNGVFLTEPDNPVAGGVIASFVPQLLLGLNGSYAQDSQEAIFVIGQDYNKNFKPDEGTERNFEVSQIGESTAQARGDEYVLTVRDSTGQLIGDGQLTLINPVFDLRFERSSTGVPVLDDLDVSGTVKSAQLVTLVRSVDGIDQEGVENLVKSVFNIPAEEDLPEELDVTFLFRARIQETE